MINRIEKVRRIAKTVTRVSVSRRGFLGAGYALSGNANPREVWLDQDGGWEDVAALAILLRSPGVKVTGISITPGIVNAATAGERIGMLLEDLQERDAKLRDDIPARSDVLATGPLTSIAKLIGQRREPRAVTWMGGAIGVRGNAKGGAEWNAAADAAALGEVMRSKIPFTICPLDLTNRFSSRDEVLDQGGSRVAQELRRAYAEKDRYWWDELAAASIAAPGLFRREKMALRADRAGRLLVDKAGRVVEVLTACDAPGFEALLHQALRF